jgi:hypothetical protein
LDKHRTISIKREPLKEDLVKTGGNINERNKKIKTGRWAISI